MVMTRQIGSLQPNGACTSDWIGQVKNRTIYAYDISTLVSENAETTPFTKENFEHALKKVSRKIKK